MAFTQHDDIKNGISQWFVTFDPARYGSDRPWKMSDMR